MSNIIKIRRTLLNMSQRELAKLTDISQSKLYRAEQKDNPFSYLTYDEIKRLSKIFNLSASDMELLNLLDRFKIKTSFDELTDEERQLYTEKTELNQEQLEELINKLGGDVHGQHDESNR
ncbi:transcriptional regulator with XRE-family HTH domain [Staphylococcus hominis]